MKFPDQKNSLILLPALLTLIILVILLEARLLQNTGGNCSYPQDAAFMNISTAKTLAFYKVWGISRYYFQSATSSLLYPLLLALVFFITGAHLIVPVIVNTALAILFLYKLQKAMARRLIKPTTQGIILLAATLLAPLPLLAVSGTENILQLLLCFLFAEALSTGIQNETSKLPPRVYIYGALAVATRYETLLLIALACILLITLNRRRQSLQLAAYALLPVVIFGVISVIKGSYFLPTPVIMGSYPLYLIILTIAAFLIGLLLIRQSYRPVVLAVLALPFILQNIIDLSHFERDSVRIYEQQFPIGKFIHRYYRTQGIGFDDLPALSYFTEGRKVDFSGTTSSDIAHSRRENSWGPAMADSLIRKNSVFTTIVPDSLFNESPPSNWHKIASWEFPDLGTGASKTFVFYSVFRWDSVLQRRMHDYQPLLPKDIYVHYY